MKLMDAPAGRRGRGEGATQKTPLHTVSVPLPKKKNAPPVTGVVCEMTLLEAARAVRRARGVTQAALARDARISRTQLVRIERGQSGRFPTSLRAIIQALGFVDGNALLEEARRLSDVRDASRLDSGSRVRESKMLARRNEKNS